MSKSLSSLVALCLISLSALPSWSQSPQPQQRRPSAPGTRQPGLKAGQVGYGTPVASVPRDFPIPLPTAGKLVSAEELVAAKGRMFYVRWRTNTEFDEAIHWYENTLKQGGWTTKTPTPGPGGHVTMLFNSKESGGYVKFAPSKNPDSKTDIIIAVNKF